MRLDNKVAVITGAAKGIGLACAQEMARHGADVVLADILADEVQNRAEEIAAQTGRRALGLACDVAQPDQVTDLIAKTVSAMGRVDIAVANAGIVRAGTILDLSPDDFDQVLGVNLRGAFLLGQAAAKQMVAQGEGGAIINMSSTNAVVAIPNQLAYVTSKGGMAQMTKAQALGLAAQNIRVNAIGPGSIMTDVLKSVAQDEAAKRMILSRTPLKRIGEPDEVAKIAVFLASDYASYLTGQTIYPDGGRLSLNYVVPVDD